MFMLRGVEARLAQEFFFQVSSIILITAGLSFGKFYYNPKKIIIAGSALVALFMFVYLKYLSGWSIMINILLGYLLFITTLRSLDVKYIRFIFKAITTVAISGALYLGLQYLGWDMRGFVLKGAGIVPHTSFFALEAAMGMYFSLALPIILSFSWLGLIMFLPLVFSWSTGAYLAGVVSTMIFAWFRQRVVFWLLLTPIVAIMGLFVLRVDNPMGIYRTRPPLWKLVIEDVFNNPIAGHGLDSFRTGRTLYFKNVTDNETNRAYREKDGSYLIPKEANDEVRQRIKDGKNPLDFWDNAHNTFIHYAYEAGLLFLVIVGYAMYLINKAFLRSKRGVLTTALFASLVTFSITSLVQFPFNLARIAHVFPILLGCFFISVKNDVA